MVQIIGITGKKFSGKDTLGKILINKYGFQRVAYADNLKEACRTIFGFTNEQLYGDLKEVNDNYWQTSPRKLLQFIGTNLFRNQIGQALPNIGDNIWIKSLEKSILNLIDNNSNIKIVITDVRFPNEAESIKSLNGKIIKIERPSLSLLDEHESESLIDDIDYDYKIINDQDLDYLESQIKNIIEN